jgi:hypothetical protein
MTIADIDGGYKPRGNLAFEPYAVMCKRLGLEDNRNKGPLTLIPEKENEAHQARQAAYYKALIAEEAAKKVHTCSDIEDFDDYLDLCPSDWCPACSNAEYERHSRAGQQLILDKYFADKLPIVAAKPVVEQKPITVKITDLQKNLIEAGGALGLMIRDSLTEGQMRPWWYYCEKYDSEWLFRKMPERAPEPGLSKEQYLGTVAEEEEEPAFFKRATQSERQTASASASSSAVRVAAIGGDEEKREAAFVAWSAKSRRERKPYFRGRTVAGSCMAQDFRVILKNLPLEVASLKADMWEIASQVAPVIDVWAPKGIVLSFASSADVDTVLNHFSNGLQYYGQVVRFERMGARTK